MRVVSRDLEPLAIEKKARKKSEMRISLSVRVREEIAIDLRLKLTTRARLPTESHIDQNATLSRGFRLGTDSPTNPTHKPHNSRYGDISMIP
jgi:hypothetical protein